LHDCCPFPHPTPLFLYPNAAATCLNRVSLAAAFDDAKQAT